MARLALIMPLLAAHCGSLPEPVTPLPPDYLALCNAMRASEADSPATALVYSEPPADVAIPPTWTMSVLGMLVPIPALHYDDVGVDCAAGRGFQPWIVLTGKELNVVIASSTRTDVPDPLSPEEGLVSQALLMDLALQHTPAELRCEPDLWEREAQLLVGLVAKGAYGYQQAYRLDNGWLAAQDQGDTWRLWSAVVPREETWYSVEYEVDPRGELGQIGLAWVLDPRPAADPPPDWLQELAAAVESPEACARFEPPVLEEAP